MRPYIREATTDSLKHSMESVRSPFQMPADADISYSYYEVQGDAVLSILFGIPIHISCYDLVDANITTRRVHDASAQHHQATTVNLSTPTIVYSAY